MGSLVGYITNSTLKREFAVVLTVWWAGIGTWLLIRSPITAVVPDAALATWAGMLIPVLGFDAAAFGADWISKQTNIAGPPINTETTVKTEVTDTAAVVTTTSEPTDPKP
jgi:hypothetical protein